METLTRRGQIKEEVVNIITEQLDLGRHAIDEDKPLQDDLGADSLDVINIVIALEDKFGIHIEDEFLQNFSSLRKVVDNLVEMMADKTQKGYGT